MQPYYEHNGITIYHGDAREVLPQLGRHADRPRRLRSTAGAGDGGRCSRGGKTLNSDTHRYAALLLRWAASLAAGDAQLGVCARPLQDAGYDVAEMEEWARTFAAKALGIVERAAPRAVTVPAGDEERRAA